MSASRAALRIALAVSALSSSTAPPAAAQLLDLSISPAVIVIPSADPDLMPLLDSAPVSVNYRVRQNNREVWLLTVQAGGDLESGGSTIDISAVTWIATPAPPFQNGTLSKTVAQTVATGIGNQASEATGTLMFQLKNSWTYDIGIYSQALVFTLSTP